MDTEGNSQILSFQPEGLYSAPGRPFATPQVNPVTSTSYAPAWLQSKIGVRWGFGNKLISFGGSQGSLIKVHHKSSAPTLTQKIVNFD